MRALVLAAVTLVALAGYGGRAEACSCCDARMARTPIGWTEAGGAVLIEVHDGRACEEKRLLEIWRIGSSRPAGCYDPGRCRRPIPSPATRGTARTS